MYPQLPTTGITRQNAKIRFDIPMPAIERFKYFPHYYGTKSWDSLDHRTQHILVSRTKYLNTLFLLVILCDDTQCLRVDILDAPETSRYFILHILPYKVNSYGLYSSPVTLWVFILLLGRLFFYSYCCSVGLVCPCSLFAFTCILPLKV